MSSQRRTHYVGYHHLTYACFCFILLQLAFLICVQSLSQQPIAREFARAQQQLVKTISTKLETLDYQHNRQYLLDQIHRKLYPLIEAKARTLHTIPVWQFVTYRPIRQNGTARHSLPDFTINTFENDPYHLNINFPHYRLRLNLAFKVTPSAVSVSFIVSILAMLAFLILWITFMLGFNLNFKSRILKGFLNHNEERTPVNQPRDLTGELIAEIQGLMDQKSLMLSALSHDLKTPLTELELKLYLLEDQQLSAQLLALTRQINQIVQTSLQYAKGFSYVKKHNRDLVPLLEELASNAGTPVKPVYFESSIETCHYAIEPILFSRMINNLIHNAQKYATTCYLSLIRRVDGKIEIGIADDGPGVPADQLRYLGRPFYRSDSSRSRQSGGSGLGLAIVKQLAHLHDLRINFANGRQMGLIVTLREM